MQLQRLGAIDATRGLIILVMATDHVIMLVGHQHSSEFWAGDWTRYQDAWLFFWRFLSHLCAPGFFFWMGAGAELFRRSREAAGWTPGRVSRFLFTRGVALLFAHAFLEIPAFALGIFLGSGASGSGPVPGPPGPVFWLTSVLFCLAVAMMILSVAVRLPLSLLASLGIFLPVLTNALLPPESQIAAPYPLWWRILLLPGIGSGVLAHYAVLPWAGVAMLGAAFARYQQHALPLGLAGIGASIGIRLAGGFGNIRLPRDSSWVEFFNFIKYPPALTFLCFMLGANLLFYAIFSKRRVEWLEVYGRAPLFFYITHLWLYSLLAVFVFKSNESGLVTAMVYGASMPLLYVACRWYGGFKARKPVDSLWRLF